MYYIPTQMLQVYGFVEEHKLLLHGRGHTVVPTVLARHLKDSQEGLLVAAMVALHENNKVKLDEADLFFQVRVTVCVSFLQDSCKISSRIRFQNVTICNAFHCECVSCRSCVGMCQGPREALSCWLTSGKPC